MNKKHTILIVDDIPQNIQLIAHHLKSLNYKLLFATSGSKSLSILMQNKVDLILLDVMMPVLNGYDTCRKIKEQPSMSDIPVIFITASNEISDIIKGFEAGGSDYITKPFYGQELVERVKTQLELKEQRDQLERNQHQLKDLLHILSHDLRNSLSGISMTMDLADIEGKHIDVYKDRIRDLSTNGLNILDLVRTMLLLEEKPLQLNCVNLNECVIHTIHLLSPRFKKKNIKQCFNSDKEYFVLAEETSLINSVLMNIITNALKFSFERGIVNISISPVGDMISLNIEDTGIGIPDSSIPHLFDLQKGKSIAGTQGEKGSGLGLPLVYKFMHAYGGDIKISSRTGAANKGNTGTIIQLLFHHPVN